MDDEHTTLRHLKNLVITVRRTDRRLRGAHLVRQVSALDHTGGALGKRRQRSRERAPAQKARTPHQIPGIVQLKVAAGALGSPGPSSSYNPVLHLLLHLHNIEAHLRVALDYASYCARWCALCRPAMRILSQCERISLQCTLVSSHKRRLLLLITKHRNHVCSSPPVIESGVGTTLGGYHSLHQERVDHCQEPRARARVV